MDSTKHSIDRGGASAHFTRVLAREVKLTSLCYLKACKTTREGVGNPLVSGWVSLRVCTLVFLSNIFKILYDIFKIKKLKEYICIHTSKLYRRQNKELVCVTPLTWGDVIVTWCST